MTKVSNLSRTVIRVAKTATLKNTAVACTFLLAFDSLGVVSPAKAACDFTSSPGLLTLDCSGTIETTADYNSAIGFSVTGPAGSINSSGGTGGTGEDLIITSTAIVMTSGLYAEGFEVFSAGGVGAMNGDNGTGGDGGDISITTSGTINTVTVGSPALLVQSYGGVGSINGSGGTAGDGGTVTITSSGAINTEGNDASAIFAQSYGSTGSINGTAGVGGNSAAVTVNSSGVITTLGDFSHGIWAASFGGAGAINGDGVGGNSGVVTVTSSANITVSGANSDAIHAYSAGGRGAFNGSGPDGTAANVTVNVTGGTVQGGSNAGYGVYIATGGGIGNTATLNNDGIIRALSGNAISGAGANVYVANRGTVIGNVTLSGANANFDNRETGIFESGSSVNAFVYNLGSMSPGGAGVIQDTAIVGNYQQNSTGLYKIDADWTGNAGAGLADKLSITGTAALAGQVVVNPINFPASSSANKGLEKTFTILTATGGITNSGLTVTDTAAVNYSLIYPDLNTLNLQAVIDFTPPPPPPVDPVDPIDPVDPVGLNPNQISVGESLNEIVSGGGSLDFIAALMTVPTQQGLANALDQLAPAGEAGAVASALRTGTTFAGQLLSCKTVGEADDTNAIIREGQCLWVRANVRSLDIDGGRQGVGFDETAAFISTGAQFDVGGPWRVGGGIGFETTNLESSSHAKSEGDRVHVGAVLKYNPGPWLMAASISGGHGWFDNERSVSFAGYNDIATSDSDTSFVSGRLTGSYLAVFDGWYAKPQLDVSITNLDRDGYVEQGGGIALDVRGSNDTVVTVSPSVELGTQVILSSGGIARPYVKGGVTWLDNDQFVTTAGFADADVSIAPFSIITQIDDVVADAAAGIDFIDVAGTVLRIQYDGHFGDLSTQHGGTAKLSFAF